jgi:O-antigen/teichoic acid export membrane protein
MGLLKDSLIISLSRVLITALMFLGDAVLSRYLGVAGKGEYFYIYNFIFMLSVTLTGGLEYGNLFYSRKGSLSQLLYNAWIYFAGISILLMIIVPSAIDLISEFPVKTNFMKACTVLGIILELIFLVSLNLLLARGSVLSYVSVRILRRIAFFIMILTVWISYHSSELSISFICYLASLFASLLLLFFFLRTDIKMKLNFRKDVFLQTITYGIKTHIGKIAERVHARACIFIIGALSSTSDIGLFSVTIGISETLLYFSNAASLAIFSRVKNEQEQQARDARTVLRHVLPIAITLSVFLNFAGQYIIEVFFGNAFTAAYSALKFILPGVTVYTIYPIVSAYLINIGKSTIASVCSIMGLCCNVVLNIFLIPHYGIEGAAISSSISYAATALFSLMIFIRHSQSSVFSALLLSAEDINKIKNYVVQVANPTNCR